MILTLVLLVLASTVSLQLGSLDDFLVLLILLAELVGRLDFQCSPAQTI
jgi:hypothetical protein